MPTPKLSSIKKAAILAEKAKGLTNKEVAEKLRVGVGTVSNVVAEAQREAEVQTPQDAHERFQDLREEFRKLIGWDGKAKPAPPSKVKDSTRKIILLNDVHVPFHDQDALAHIIKTHAMNTNLLVLGGDIHDNYNVSKYPKFKRPSVARSAVQELRQVKVVMQSLSEAFPYIVAMPGNHDAARWMKYLERHGLPPEAMEYMEFMAPGVVYNPMARITEGLPNIEIAEPIRHEYAEFPHIFQLNDVVFSHAEKFSKQANKAVADVVLWLKKFMEPLGLVKPFRMVCHAHTHMAGQHFDGFGVVGMECGTLSKLPDYAGDPKLRGADKPPVIGYTEIYQDENGRTDLQRSRFVPLRWGTERYF